MERTEFNQLQRNRTICDCYGSALLRRKCLGTPQTQTSHQYNWRCPGFQYESLEGECSLQTYGNSAQNKRMDNNRRNRGWNNEVCGYVSLNFRFHRGKYILLFILNETSAHEAQFSAVLGHHLFRAFMTCPLFSSSRPGAQAFRGQHPINWHMPVGRRPAARKSQDSFGRRQAGLLDNARREIQETASSPRRLHITGSQPQSLHHGDMHTFNTR